MKILAILGMVLVLSLGVATPALAFNPQPEPPSKPLENALNAVVNALGAVDQRLEAVMSNPPDPYIPGTNGIIGQLNAMTNQLEVQLGRVEAVLSIPPDPYNELREPLAAVRSVALRISERAGMPPDPWREIPSALEALQGVQQAANDIVNATMPPS